MNKLQFIIYNAVALPFLIIGYTFWATFRALEEIIEEYKFNYKKNE